MKEGKKAEDPETPPDNELQKCYRLVVTQFGDWSGPSRPLSSACAQGIVV